MDPITYKQPRIVDLSKEDRPREKALSQGLGAMTTTELIALLLGSGSRGESVIQLSQRILYDCDYKLQNLSKRSIQNLIRSFKGMGEAKSITLLAAIELGKRFAQEGPPESPEISTPARAYTLMADKLSGLDHEEFWVAYLNNANKVIKRIKIGQGGVTATVADVKIIMHHAVDYLATAIILYHNHPSGNTRPSEEDDKLTKKIHQAASTLDITLMDHIIIGADSYYSYTNAGKL